MTRICTLFFLVVLYLIPGSVVAQNDTLPGASVDPALMGLYNAKYPKKYIIADIQVKGNKAFDPAIVISV